MAGKRATDKRKVADGERARPSGNAVDKHTETETCCVASPRAAALIFFTIIAVAFVLRWIHLLQSRASVFFNAPTADGKAYFDWSQRIVAGDWLGGEVFYQAPLYPYFLALVQLLFGGDLWGIRLTQAALGAASCGLVFLAGRAFFSTAVGAAAGLMLAVYPPAIFFDGLIQKAGIGLFWMALLLWLVGRAQQRPTAARWAGAGAVLGALCLTRENALLLIPVIALWLLLRFSDRSRTRRMAWIASLAGGLTAALLPVGLRNLAVGGEFALTTSQAGSNFYIGNNPNAYGIYIPLRRARGGAAWERDDATVLARQAVGRELTPREVSRYWFSRSWEFIRDRPGAWLTLLARKLMFTLNAYEIPDSQDQYFYHTFCPLIRSLGFAGHFGVLFPLATAGIVLTWRRRRELWLLYAASATIIAGVAMFFVFARYRFPLVAILVLFAGAAVTEGCAAFKAGRFARLTIALAALIAAAAFSNQPPGRIDKDSQMAVSHMNTAVSLADLERFEESLQHGRAAIEIQPRIVEAYVALGRAYMGLGQPQRAVEEFERALAIWPDYVSALVHIGRARIQQRRWQEAADALRRAMKLDPRDRDAKLERAWLLAVCPQASLRDGAAAAAMVQPMCARDGPLRGQPRPLDVLAAAYAELGRFDEAVSSARRALAAAKSDPRKHDSLAAEIERRIELYESGRPYRLPEN